MLLSLALTSSASAQFFPIFGLPTIGEPGIAFQMGGKNLQIGGFIPTGPAYAAVLPVTPTPFGFRQVGPAIVPYGAWYPGYGSVDQRVTVQIISPAGIAVQSRRVTNNRPKYDLSGIDLDVESPDKIWGSKQNAKAPGPPKNMEMAKAAPPDEKKQPVIAIPAKPPAPPPILDLPPDGKRLVDLGIFAFRKGEYGSALLRFRQASEEKPPPARTAFLQAQACLAVGKYREAARLIQMGLQREPTWPTSGFAPRADLYNNNAEVWTAHREQLEQALKKDPKNADYLFLLGYLAWFDGQREAAVAYFQRASELAAEPRWSESFLKVAKK
jgi:hypothetical protein